MTDYVRCVRLTQSCNKTYLSVRLTQSFHSVSLFPWLELASLISCDLDSFCARPGSSCSFGPLCSCFPHPPFLLQVPSLSLHSSCVGVTCPSTQTVWNFSPSVRERAVRTGPGQRSLLRGATTATTQENGILRANLWPAQTQDIVCSVFSTPSPPEKVEAKIALRRGLSASPPPIAGCRDHTADHVTRSFTRVSATA